EVGDDGRRVVGDGAPFHAKVADGLRRGRTAIDVELSLVAPIRAQMRAEDAAVLARAGFALRLHHDRASAVAEQHASGAVAPIEDARKGLRPYHQRTLECAGLE